MRKTSKKCAIYICALLCIAFFVNQSYAEAIRDLGIAEVKSSADENSRLEFEKIEITPSQWQGRNLSLAEILAEQPGIIAHRHGGLGSFQSISIRGSDSKNVLICIDEIPREDAGGGVFDLGSIDLNAVEKIEIYKGYIPAKFGAGSIGGVVNFVMKKNPVAKGEMLLGYGSHNMQMASASLSQDVSNAIITQMRFSTAFSYRHSDNDYKFLNRNGTEYNEDDDYWAKRKNADYTQISGTHTLYKVFENDWLTSIGISHSNENGGNPGRESDQTVVAGFEKSFLQLNLNTESPTIADKLTFVSQTVGKFEKSTSHSFYPLDKIGYPNDKYMIYGAGEYSLQESFIFDIRACANCDWGGTLKLNAGIQNLSPRDNNEISSAYDWELKRKKAEVSAEGNAKFGRILRWNISGSGIFYDDRKMAGILYMPTAEDYIPEEHKRKILGTARTAFYLGENAGLWLLSFSAGKYARMPQPLELYGVYRGMVANPNLQPETGYNTEFNTLLHSPSKKSEIQISFFANFAKDRIMWVDYDFISKPYNLGKSSVLGLELLLSSKPLDFLKLSVNATFQQPKELSKGIYNENKLPMEPEKSIHSSITLFLPFSLELNLNAESRSEVFADRANRKIIPSQSFFNANLAFAFANHVRIVLAANNLTNQDYQNIYNAYPLPGREFSGTLIIKH